MSGPNQNAPDYVMILELPITVAKGRDLLWVKILGSKITFIDTNDHAFTVYCWRRQFFVTADQRTAFKRVQHT